MSEGIFGIMKKVKEIFSILKKNEKHLTISVKDIFCIMNNLNDMFCIYKKKLIDAVGFSKEKNSKPLIYI